MVSSVLDLTDEELAAELCRMGQVYTDDDEWQKLRAGFPDEWPF